MTGVGSGGGVVCSRLFPPRATESFALTRILRRYPVDRPWSRTRSHARKAGERRLREVLGRVPVPATQVRRPQHAGLAGLQLRREVGVTCGASSTSAPGSAMDWRSRFILPVRSRTQDATRRGSRQIRSGGSADRRRERVVAVLVRRRLDRELDRAVRPTQPRITHARPGTPRRHVVVVLHTVCKGSPGPRCATRRAPRRRRQHRGRALAEPVQVNRTDEDPVPEERSRTVCGRKSPCGASASTS